MSFGHCKSPESETALLKRSASWPEYTTIESLTPEALQQITEKEGVDFATALLFDRFKKSPQHADFIRQVDILCQHPAQRFAAIDSKVVVVPGALYEERPDLGGDGRLVAETVVSAGWSCDFIPLASAGSVSENARLIRRWLREHSKEKIILVSLSKGGTEVGAALAAPDAPPAFCNVAAWINVCGPLNGSFMADWVLASRLRTCFFRAQFWLQNRDFKFVTDLRHNANALNDVLPLLFPNLKVINIVGFPLQRHMTTPFSRFCHRKLSVYGPNDGTISLSDLRTWPGNTYPAWGADHYFRPETRARQLIAAIFAHLAVGHGLEASVPVNEGLAAPANSQS